MGFFDSISNLFETDPIKQKCNSLKKLALRDVCVYEKDPEIADVAKKIFLEKYITTEKEQYMPDTVHKSLSELNKKSESFYINVDRASAASESKQEYGFLEKVYKKSNS